MRSQLGHILFQKLIATLQILAFAMKQLLKIFCWLYVCMCIKRVTRDAVLVVRWTMELGHVTDAVVGPGRTGQMADLFMSSSVHKTSQSYGLQIQDHENHDITAATVWVTWLENFKC